MKSIKVIAIIVSTVLLTGCANNLKCNVKTNNYEAHIKIVFENDKPSTYTYKDKMDFSGGNIDNKLYYNTKSNELNNLIKDKYATIKSNKNSASVTVHYDFQKNNSNGEKELLISRHDTKKEAITKIESLGYKCK